MVSDTEPRYRLVDANDNVVGSLYAEADGTLKLQEGTSGSDNEVSVATDGTFNAPAVSTAKLTVGGGDEIDRIEYGSYDFGSISGSADNTWGTNTFESTTITFDSAFASAPTVVVGAGSAGLVFAVESVTTSDFVLGVNNYKDVAIDPVATSWVAIGSQ